MKATKQGTASQKADSRGARKKVINFLIFDIFFAEFPIRFFLVTDWLPLKASDGPFI